MEYSMYRVALIEDEALIREMIRLNLETKGYQVECFDAGEGFLDRLADAAIPVERAREMKATLPIATLTELPEVGHMPFWEAPQATAAAILDLL
jgi:DNA-binding response OmpR family regulator